MPNYDTGEGTPEYYRLRNKWADQAIPDPNSHPYRRNFYLKLFASYVFAAPFVVVGLGLCLTVIGILLGVPLMIFGVIPLHSTHATRVAHLTLWEASQERPLFNEDDRPPWDM